MVFPQLRPNKLKHTGPTIKRGFSKVENCIIWWSDAQERCGNTFFHPSLLSWKTVHWASVVRGANHGMCKRYGMVQCMEYDIKSLQDLECVEYEAGKKLNAQKC